MEMYGWLEGRIMKTDVASRQIQVNLSVRDKSRKFWIHLDNRDEVRLPVSSKAGNNNDDNIITFTCTW